MVSLDQHLPALSESSLEKCEMEIDSGGKLKLLNSLLRLKIPLIRYEKDGVFTAEQLKEIKKVTLARLLCDNGDRIDRIQVEI